MAITAYIRLICTRESVRCFFGAAVIGKAVPPDIDTSIGAEAKPLAITRSDEGPFSIEDSTVNFRDEGAFVPIEVLLKSNERA